MVKEKTWKEFRETGLLLIINQILHIFGWAIVFNFEGDKITSVYPARVKFRGFDNKNIEENYIKVSKYMVDNAEDLYIEALD